MSKTPKKPTKQSPVARSKANFPTDGDFVFVIYKRTSLPTSMAWRFQCLR